MIGRKNILLSILALAIILSSVVTIVMVRAQASDFSIAAFPSLLTASTPGSVTTTIVVGSLNGFSGTVALSVSISPAVGLTATCSSSSVPVAAGGNSTVTCIYVCQTPGTYNSLVTGTSPNPSGTLTHSTNIIVICQPTVPPPTVQMFVFTVKWICNVAFPGIPFNPNTAETIGLVPGEYKTDINVHNPSFANETLSLKKKIVVSTPEAPSVNATRFVFLFTTLGPDGAFFMSCKEILSALGLPLFRPLKGFVEIITTEEHLNVVAEYSAESINPTTGASTGISLDVETISPGPFIP